MAKNATYRDMQQLLPLLDDAIATKDELVALKSLTFRQAVIPSEQFTSIAENNVSGDNENEVQVDASNEISVNMPDQAKGLRRVVKTSPSRTAHFRIAGSYVEKQTGASIIRDKQSETGVQFTIEEITNSIRPRIYSIGGSVSNEKEEGLRKSSPRMRTFSSYSQGKHDNTVGDDFEPIFPYSLPASLLAEANDDVWTHSIQIVSQTSTLCDITPADDVCDDLEKSNKNDDSGASQGDLHDDATKREQTSASVVDYRSMYQQGSPETDEQDCGSDTLVDMKENQSVFGGIWEKAYRENMTKETTVVDPTDNSTITQSSRRLDFAEEELKAQYDGPTDYNTLFVSSDLDLYFDSFVFPRGTTDDDGALESSSEDQNLVPRIQLFKFDRNALIEGIKHNSGTSIPKPTEFAERYVGVWKEDVLACGSYARSRLTPISISRRGFHGEVITRAGKNVSVSESRKFIVCLSASALYFIVNDDVTPPSQQRNNVKRVFPSKMPSKATFGDAPWPHAVIRHSLDCLVGITIGFQFQRLILRFSVSNGSVSKPSLEYTYVLLTSNKLQTISLLQKLQSHVIDARLSAGSSNSVLIENDDKAFLDALGSRSDEIVLHYQILHQLWKRGDREAARRALVVTDSNVYLLDETYAGDGSEPDDNIHRLGDVSLAIIDSARLGRVSEVRAANEDPRMITLVILPQNKLKRSHRWRLVCNDGEGAERLIEDVRKAMRSALEIIS